jgi:hypothetical protein
MKIPVLVAGLLCALPALAASPAAQSEAPAAPRVLSSILHPPLKIVDATVVDASGAAIGTVARVEVSPAGVPLAVAVTPAGNPDQVRVLDAGAVSYDAASNRIVARAAGRG